METMMTMTRVKEMMIAGMQGTIFSKRMMAQRHLSQATMQVMEKDRLGNEAGVATENEAGVQGAEPGTVKTIGEGAGVMTAEGVGVVIVTGAEAGVGVMTAEE